MNQTFKVGDRVKRAYDFGSTFSEGAVYTVARALPSHPRWEPAIHLDGIRGAWHAKKFTLIKRIDSPLLDKEYEDLFI